MKRIAVITYDLDWIFAGGAKSGGASVVNKNLILELSKMNDVEVTIFCLPTDFVPVEGIKIEPISHGHGFEAFLTEIEEKVKIGNFDVVLTVSLEYMKRNPILQCQSFRHRCKTEKFPVNIIKTFLSAKKIKHQDKQFQNLPKNNKYIAVSESIKQDYVENYNLKPENVFVCHLATEQVLEDLSEIVKNEKLTFGCVANNSINKGGLLFLMGLGVLNIFNKNFKAFVISSKFKKSSAMNFLISILGLKSKVEFVEQQADIKEFYKKIDCLVLPSKNEAFGLVVLEAMAFGKPCIVSSTAGVAEIIDNESGVIFKRNSFIDFVKSLDKMVKLYKSEKYNEMAKNAFEASKKYTWKAFVENVLKCF